MPGRSYTSQSYRYGFNGQERDDEMKGSGNSLDFGARIFDPRLGMWLSVDPLQAKYPSLSPYNFVANSPLLFVDPDGREINVSSSKQENGRTLLSISFSAEIVNTSNKSISSENLTSIKNQIQTQIVESFAGEYDDFDVEISFDIQERKSFDDITGELGHIISIVNPDDEVFKDLGDVGATERVDSERGNIFISSSIIDDEKQLKRTGAHEFGHAAGLEHPDGDHATDVDKVAGNDPDNLMHQSRYSSGTNINKDQLKQVKKDNE